MVCIERMNDLGVDKIYTSEMLKKYKSDTGKKFLLSVLNDFKIEKQEILHIGDSDSDILAGENAGCKTARVTDEESLYDIVERIL